MGSPGRSLGMCTGVMAWVPSGSASHFHFSSKLRPADRSFIPSWWLCLAVDFQFALSTFSLRKGCSSPPTIFWSAFDRSIIFLRLLRLGVVQNR